MSEVETQTEVPVLPKGEQNPIATELVEKLAALKSIVTIDKILQNCIVPGGMAGEILVSQEFLKGLHGPLLKDAQSHPDWARATNTAKPAVEQVAVEKAAAKRNRKARRKVN